MRAILSQYENNPFDAALKLALSDVQPGSWSIKSILAGQITSATIAGLLVIYIPQIISNAYSDLRRHINEQTIKDPKLTSNPYPVERACQEILVAAVKLNANHVVCRITNSDGTQSDLEIFRK